MDKVIYTGYIAQVAKYKNAGLDPILITASAKIKLMRISELAPPWIIVDSIKKGKITQAQYTEMYIEHLNKLGVRYLRELIEGLMEKYNPILLCYEKPTDFCHRHILAEWIKSNLNIECKEYLINKK